LYLNACITAQMSSAIRCQIDKLVKGSRDSGISQSGNKCKCAELATLDDRPELKRNRVLTSLS